MSLKKIKILNIFLVFALMFPIHYGYKLFPNSFTSLFFPVNESIWEHMKMIYTAMIIYGLIDFILLRKLKFNNFFLALFASSILSIPIYLIMFLPLSSLLGLSMILIYIILFLTCFIAQIISYLLLICPKLNLSIGSIIAIITVYIIMGYLTYHPPKTPLFFDEKNEKYGINIYQI